MRVIIIMANVHRIGDYNNPQNAGRYNPLNDDTSGPLQMVSLNKIPFLYSPPTTRPALAESIPYTIKLTFCPSLKLLSLTVFIVTALISLYIASCALGINNKTSVLQIQSSVLIRLGANVPGLVYNGQVYRLITAAFLHANLPHLLSNLFSIFFILTRLQQAFNVLYLIALYLISAIGGNILSDVTSKKQTQIAVGASTAILGYIGTLIAYLVINWKTLKRLGQLRCQLVCMIGMITFFSIFLTLMKTSDGVDIFGHLGGFAAGLSGAMLILPRIDRGKAWITRGLGAAGLLALYLASFLVFYLDKY